MKAAGTVKKANAGLYLVPFLWRWVFTEHIWDLSVWSHHNKALTCTVEFQL